MTSGGGGRHGQTALKSTENRTENRENRGFVLTWQGSRQSVGSIGCQHQRTPRPSGRVPKFRYLSESKRNFGEISQNLNGEPKFRYLIVDKFK